MSVSANETKQNKPMWQALGLAWDLGYTIAVPLVILALGGRLTDKWLGTSPWFLLVGVLLSIMLSTWLVYRKMKLIVSAQADNEKNQSQKMSKGDDL